MNFFYIHKLSRNSFEAQVHVAKRHLHTFRIDKPILNLFPSLSTNPSWVGNDDKCGFYFPLCFSDERVFLLFHKNLSDSLTQLAQAIHAVLSRKTITKHVPLTMDSVAF